jgi:hypothetical protein
VPPVKVSESQLLFNTLQFVMALTAIRNMLGYRLYFVFHSGTSYLNATAVYE